MCHRNFYFLYTSRQGSSEYGNESLGSAKARNFRQNRWNYYIFKDSTQWRFSDSYSLANCEIRKQHVGFRFLIAVFMKRFIFWLITLFSLLKKKPDVSEEYNTSIFRGEE
jgi:hypothetical protein